MNSGAFTLTATASSGLTVQFSSLTTTVCTVSGNTVTLVGTGSCTIAAEQPGDATYAPAVTVIQGFNVTDSVAYQDSDVPLPAWALVLLGGGLLGAMRLRLAGRR